MRIRTTLGFDLEFVLACVDILLFSLVVVVFCEEDDEDADEPDTAGGSGISAMLLSLF